MLCLWSAKGGSGCTVAAVAVGILAARHDETLLVDLGGDVAAALGAPAAPVPPADLAVGDGSASGRRSSAQEVGPAGEPGPWFDGADGADDVGPGWGVHGWGIAGWLHAPDPPPDALARFETELRPGLHLLPWGSGPAGGLFISGDCRIGMPETSPSGPPPGAGQGPALSGQAGLSGQTGLSAQAGLSGQTGLSGRAVPANELLAQVTQRLWALARLLAGDTRRVVVDLGRGPGAMACWQAPLLDLADCSMLVTRSCYLGLSRAARLRRPDGVILVDELGRALGPRDVADALGVPITASLTWDPAVARAVDAGLLLRRLPRSLRPLETVADSRLFRW